MSLTGTNKLCAQCIHECKQWSQVKVIRCPFFRSRQQRSAKSKKPDTLQAGQRRIEPRREAIFCKKGYVAM